MELEIKALTPDLLDAYLDFFDHRAFSDGSPYYPCYCSAFNMRAAEIEAMKKAAAMPGGGTESWREALRASAAKMVKEGKIRGYLAFDGEAAVGWCNANDRMNYDRVGEFDLDHVPEDRAPAAGLKAGQIKSVVCFEISPPYRGMGVAAQLLRRVCADAQGEGYDFVEAYPVEHAQPTLAFTGPIGLYEKAGFTVCSKTDAAIVMRKALRENRIF